MPTECIQHELDLGSSGGRKLVGAFDGGAITSKGGVVLLAAADRAIGLGRRLAGCFTDLRVADAVRHSVADLLRQRIFGIALGHEDLIDHDVLRDDPALAAVRIARTSCWQHGDYETRAAEPRLSPGINSRGTLPSLSTLPEGEIEVARLATDAAIVENLRLPVDRLLTSDRVRISSSMSSDRRTLR